MFIQLANYSVIKFKVLKNKEDTSYSTVTQLNGLDPENLITQEMTNFNFAVGVFAKRFAFFGDDIEDYLDITVNMYAGRANEVDESKTLGMHRCREDEVKNFNKPQNPFDRSTLGRKIASMMCVDDPSDLSLHGAPQTAREKTLYITVDRCTGKDSCKSPTEIDQFFENHILTFLHNQREYDPSSYGNEAIVDDVIEEWLPFDPKRSMNAISLQQNIIVSEEDILGLHFTEAIE